MQRIIPWSFYLSFLLLSYTCLAIPSPASNASVAENATEISPLRSTPDDPVQLSHADLIVGFQNYRPPFSNYDHMQQFTHIVEYNVREFQASEHGEDSDELNRRSLQIKHPGSGLVFELTAQPFQTSRYTYLDLKNVAATLQPFVALWGQSRFIKFANIEVYRRGEQYSALIAKGYFGRPPPSHEHGANSTDASISVDTS